MEKFLIKNKRKHEGECKDDPDKKTAKHDMSCDTSQATNKQHDEAPCSIDVKTLISKPLSWRELRAENLDCDYCVLFQPNDADRLMSMCENCISYNEGQQTKVRIFGKWHNIPRKQVAHGDAGLSYTFSGLTVPARPWTPFLTSIRDAISDVTGYNFNFVLVNRYKDGSDHIGEHRDDEKDLVANHPIASLSLGQARDFVFKHADARGKNAKRSVETVKIELEHGGLLMMKHPTNTFWYHSLPQRKRLTNPRINFTFRKMVT